ncbi:uncharacterized protein LOC132724882 [Ruditapes philippinarum]|uniref:uncharacterized protein LOC132724882 n=1 Tax=Ruditapes philippinarum TaxID=129788 RepID=UPI00295AE0C9|nr:uncharacterized protein LOC132724882 [Ruditapes philippinarum]
MTYKTRATLICILCTCQSIVGLNHVFLCTFNQHQINIELQCKGDSKINIVYGWGFESDKTYTCANNKSATVPEVLHALGKAMWHKILAGCVAKSYCNIPHFSERFPNDKSHGIAIEYNCLPDDSFLQFCHQSFTLKTFYGNPNGVDLIFKSDGNTTKLCICDVETNGHIETTLTIFPTKSMTLKVKSGGKVTRYNNEVLIRSEITNGNDRSKQTFVVDYATEPHNGVPFLLLQFSFSILGDMSLNCSENQAIKPQEKKKASPSNVDTSTPDKQTPETTHLSGYAITATVTAMSTILIIVIIVVFLKKKQGTKANKKDILPTSAKKYARNMQASFSVNCTDSLSHSYAEIGSISDYRHYVMPDETSQQSFKMKICLEKVCDSNDNDRRKPNVNAIDQRKQKSLPKAKSANKVDPVIYNAVKDVDIITKEKIAENNTECKHIENKVEQEQRLPEIPNKSKANEITSILRVSGDKHNLENDKRKISMEHYDPSGYLDLDITEKTSHQYLQKWMKEFYAVEQKAKLEDKQRKDADAPQVGQRKVLIVKNEKAPERHGNFYSYADDHRVAFSDEETLFNNQK